MATALVYNPQQHSTVTMPKNTKQVDTGQQWSGRSARYSHPVQAQDPYANQDGYPTPITATGFLQSSRQAGPSRPRGTTAMEMEIDGMENKAREMTINEEEPSDGRMGTEKPYAERDYTEIRELGDGSFGTVWLCDWHSPIKSEHMLSAMQSGAGARPEWTGKRLVALKRMKRVWEGGWDQARTLQELSSLSRIPYHPAVIPLYDAYISPSTHQLHFVFEPMEGNLYQLTKARNRRPLAAGLVASCFHQIVGGLHHVHSYGYFHRDMKPENLLVTTIGLADYLTPEALQHINASRGSSSGSDGPLPITPNNEMSGRTETDVSVIVKLADFGLARETRSKPPYTQYVSTRWYRAPEILLRSDDYNAAVDMWALGTILAEMVNLKPIFPGVSEIDQVHKIAKTLGDPNPAYGVDDRGRPIGGGVWNTGIKLAKAVSFRFPQYVPLDFRKLFDARVPQSLVDCIADLLRWNPAARLTSEQCIDHPYFHETIPHLQRTPPLPQIPFSSGQPPVVPPMERPAPLDAPPRSVPPSHSHHTGARPAFANGETRVLPPPVATPENMNRIFLPPGHYRPDASAASALVNQLRELDLPTAELASYGTRQPVRAEETFGQRPAPHAPYLEEPKRRQPSGSVYDGSVYEGSNPSIPHIQPQTQSTSSFHQQQQQSPRHEPPHAQSRSSLHQQYTHTTPQQSPSQQSNRDSLPPHVTAFVQQQQQQMAMSPPQESYIPPPIEQSPVDARPPQPTIGKKKKWGLSSVFGGGDKSASSTSIVGSTSNLLSASTLKRTQSGQHTSDRSASDTALPPLSDDPKKAKKEAAARAKELAMAQREATARAQQERARAVMQKRNQIVGDRVQGRSKVDLEYGRGDSAGIPDARSAANQSAASLHVHQQQQQQQQYASSSSRLAPLSSNMGATASTPNFPTQRTYASMPPSASLSSIRSLDSGQSHSTTNQLSAETLSKYDTGSRSKARRRENDYDHSESDHASLRNRSVLSIGTVDSDPGPRRSRDVHPDPMIAAAEARRRPSASNLNRHRSPSRLTSGSNPSLESQLAQDFQRHAPFAASSSATSLGRHGASHLSLHDTMPPVPPVPSNYHGHMQGSAPPSPYGHPNAAAVAHGAGLGRQVLPSISQWDQDVNPMFRVPPAQQGGSGTTLPPFSAIAQVADNSPSQSRQSPRP